jgi:hypothetical protein
MTQSELLTNLTPLDSDQQIRWMLNLGAFLTIAARNFYEAGTDNAEGPPLRGFNEIQHRVYGRIQDLRDGKEWTLESFVDMIINTAAHFKIWSSVAWALERSLPLPPAGMKIAHCKICNRPLNKVTDPLSADCGADCWGCVGMFEAELGQQESVEAVRKEIAAGLRDANGTAKPFV